MFEIYFSEELFNALLKNLEGKVWYEQPLFIALASGMAAVLASIATALSTLSSQKSREQHEEKSLAIKIESEKKKMVHEKKISALQDFAVLKESMVPSVWGDPSADAHGFYDDFLRFSAERYLKELVKFKDKWVYILSDNVLSEVKKSIFILNEFDYKWIDDNICDCRFSLKCLNRIGEVDSSLSKALDAFKREMGVNTEAVA